MTPAQIKHFFTEEGLDPNNIDDIRRKLRVIQMDNAWHFVNTRDDVANQLLEINYDDSGALGGGYIKLRECIRDFWRVSYKPFDMIQGLIFATGETPKSYYGDKYKNMMVEDISELKPQEKYEPIATSAINAEMILTK